MSLTPEIVLNAYASGIFPMSEGRNDPEVFWVDPRERGVMPLGGFHISRSLAKQMRKREYLPAINQDFRSVVQACAARDETWINAEIFDLYTELHLLGFAHSFEIYQDQQLIGGTYGVSLGAAFFGESMFSARTGGSKLALAHLVDHLSRAGFTLFDTQFLTPHLASLGGIEISRAAYRSQLSEALGIEGKFLQTPLELDAHLVLQRVTQTS
ncbi:leucyl/phenylalanyl-tRNA--protein transferase [Lentibacter algarum]|uniref:leucyl/phenylalanyl-tRNA--protein transferase n=1 Tax=Lentibacter algarum TaxID=576131 RepID=UPI001C065E99|nr:leucyl/phenylalanyl-tRNA--protein transferase [Lentibacter algarum]MBU2982112.1 leucyl/phenylalanyl-tRNA--protein transferase [Lentibacter algarum]